MHEDSPQVWHRQFPVTHVFSWPTTNRKNSTRTNKITRRAIGGWWANKKSAQSQSPSQHQFQSIDRPISKETNQSPPNQNISIMMIQRALKTTRGGRGGGGEQILALPVARPIFPHVDVSSAYDRKNGNTTTSLNKTPHGPGPHILKSSNFYFCF